MESMDKATLAVEQQLQNVHGIEFLLTTVGSRNTVNRSEIFVRLTDIEDRTVSFNRLMKELLRGDLQAAFQGNFSQQEKMQEVRDILAEFPDLRASVRNLTSFRQGPPVDIDFSITGPTLEGLLKYGNRLLEEAEQIPGIVDADITLKMTKPELQVHIDRERAAVLGVPESHDPVNAGSADADVIPVAATLLTEDVVKREEAGAADGKGGNLVLRAAVVLGSDLSVHGVHDEVVGIISTEVDVVGPGGEVRHVEVAVDANREVITTTVEPAAISIRDLPPTVTMAGKGFDSVEGAVRGRVTGHVDVVVTLSLVVEDHATRVVVLLVVEAGPGEIRGVGPGREFVDRNEGRLHHPNSGDTVCIVRVGILVHLESITGAVSIGIIRKRV